MVVTVCNLIPRIIPKNRDLARKHKATKEKNFVSLWLCERITLEIWVTVQGGRVCARETLRRLTSGHQNALILTFARLGAERLQIWEDTIPLI